MDNQHRQIKGYRDLTQEEINLMNEIKQKGVELQALYDKVRGHYIDQRQATWAASSTVGMTKEQEDEKFRLDSAEPERWAAIAKTHFQEGLMSLTRAVAQPAFF